MEETTTPRAAGNDTCHPCARCQGLQMLCQRTRNSIILPLGGTLNIFEQIQTPPNVLLLLKHTCMLSVSTLSSNKPRSVHLRGLTPALSLLCEIGLRMSSLTVSGHTSFSSSLDHPVFSLHPILFGICLLLFWSPTQYSPSLFSFLPPFLSGSPAHAALKLTLQVTLT